MTSRVAIYARVSSGRQEQEQTVETQLMVTRDYCAAEGLAAEEFIDEDWSGTSTLLEERPAGAALVEAIKRKEVDTVIVYKRDRLGRDLNLGLAERLLTKLKATVISVTQPHTNATGFVGKQARRVESFSSGMFADYVTENMMNGRYRKVAEGKYMASFAPFGYQVIRCDCRERRKCRVGEHGTLEPHPEHAEVIRHMFAWAAQGEGLWMIAGRLEEAGIKVPLPPGKAHKPKKREWHASTVLKILSAERYVGRATYAGRPMQCPALVDEETFETARERIKERGLRMKGRVKRDYLLRGLVMCRFCGSPCRAKTDHKASTGWTQPVYECRERAVYPESRRKHEGLKRRYQARSVEETVKRWIIALRTDPEAALSQARLFAAETGERKAAKRRERESLAARLERLDEQEARVNEGWREGIYRDKQQFEQELLLVREERDRLQSEMRGTASGLHPAIEKMRALSGSTKPTFSDRIQVSPELESFYVQRAAEMMKEMPPLDPKLVDMLVENVAPLQWADEVKLLVRQVWIENDGRVTVEGVIAASPSDSVDKLSPRS